MAKKVTFIPGVDAMSGILAGRAGKLVYAENDNKAYDAPLGTNYARNYGARIVLAQRAKDGKAYFSVKTKSATKISAKTRTNMAILGSIAAIRSAIQFGQPTIWANLHAIYEYRKEHGGDEAGANISFNKWLDYWLRQMLLYKQSTLTLTASGISVTVNNPYANNSNAMLINERTFTKFYPVLFPSDLMPFYMNGKKYFCEADIAWEDICKPVSGTSPISNPNLAKVFMPFTIVSAGANPMYNGEPIYDAAGTEQTSETSIVADAKYTTIAPQD